MATTHTYRQTWQIKQKKIFIAILNEAFYSATKFLTAPLYSVLNSLTHRRCYSFGVLARSDQLTSINIRHQPKIRITGFGHTRWGQQFSAICCNAENNILSLTLTYTIGFNIEKKKKKQKKHC